LCGNVNFHAVDPRFIEDLADYDNTVKSIIATGIVSDEFINEYSNVFFSKDLFKNMPEDAYIKKYINKLPKYYKKKFIDIASEYYNYLRTVVLPTMSRDSLYTRILILTTGSVELIALAEALFKDSPISVFYFGKIHSDNAEYLLTKILPKYLDLNFEKVLSINPEYHKERCLDIKKLDKFLPKETVRVPEAIIRGDLSGLPPNLNYTKK
jgi:hypothetical protein